MLETAVDDNQTSPAPEVAEITADPNIICDDGSLGNETTDSDDEFFEIVVEDTDADDSVDKDSDRSSGDATEASEPSEPSESSETDRLLRR